MTTLVKSLYLSAENYGPDKGRLRGKIEFMNQHGEMHVAVNNEQAEKIIAILADNLVATAQQTAALMTAEVLSQAAGNTELIEG